MRRQDSRAAALVRGGLLACVVVVFGAPTEATAAALTGIGDKCLDVRGGTAADGTPIQIFTCHGGANQDWHLDSMPDTRTGAIRGPGGKCIDIRNGAAADGTPTELRTCDGSPRQRWTFTTKGELQHANGKCLDVRGGTSTDGTSAQLFGCHGGANQRWTFRINVAFFVDQMSAFQVTETGPGNTRDEIYLAIFRSSPTARAAERLPRYPSNDDYYEFVQFQNASGANLGDWTNQDQARVGRPVVWSGQLVHEGRFTQQDGWHSYMQGVSVLVMLGEQDNKTPGQIRQAIEAACDVAEKAVGQAEEIVKIATGVCKNLAGLIPSNTTDDVLGAFVVELRNNLGRLESGWVPLSDFVVRAGERGSTTLQNSRDPYAAELRASGLTAEAFTMSGANGARYELVVAGQVGASPLPTSWQYLGRVSSACSRATVSTVAADGSRVALGKGEFKTAAVAANRNLRWFCGTSAENATLPADTNRIVVERYTTAGPGLPTDRQFWWFCFRESRF